MSGEKTNAANLQILNQGLADRTFLGILNSQIFHYFELTLLLFKRFIFHARKNMKNMGADEDCFSDC